MRPCDEVTRVCDGVMRPCDEVTRACDGATRPGDSVMHTCDAVMRGGEPASPVFVAGHFSPKYLQFCFGAPSRRVARVPVIP